MGKRDPESAGAFSSNITSLFRNSNFVFSESAGEGNRTLVGSLEGYSFTIKLHPRAG